MASSEVIRTCYECGKQMQKDEGAVLVNNLDYKGHVAWFHLKCYEEYVNRDDEDTNK